ncbi:MAG: hypothetical protein HYR56_19840 [Acidobacteria bacterium]|nr:hypothetical protein [Acidobacteriota bacterium]MBI3421896.1 hypothetical protein [Acidobacteriota bacterium]
MALNYEAALRIAERYISERILNSARLSRYEFGEVGLQSENESFWTFLSGSAQLVEEGYVPGAVYACIGKEDGRVWSMAEVEQFYLQKAAARQTQPNAAAAA